VDKGELRRVMRQRRTACDPALGARLAGHLLASGIVKPGAVVAGFWPLAGEIDCRAALLALIGRGHTAGLPVTPPIGEALSFRRWRPGVALVPGRFGTAEPTGDIIVPTILLMPLLAFDRFGARLGYGGGYYDRTLERLGAGTFAVGCGFAIQEVDRVPTETHDRTLNAVATEAGVIVVE
jgi:5-formyltetrahydrofolate cyclo-ligase